MGFEKPRKIKDAQAADNTDYLLAAGRKGAEVTNEMKRRERERKEICELQSEVEEERRALEDELQRRASNEHIITPDGEDLEVSKE